MVLKCYNALCKSKKSLKYTILLHIKEKRVVPFMDKKKKNILITIVLLIGIIVIIGVSYALWGLNLTQTGKNDIASSCFNITFTDKDNISLQKAYPILDEEGKKLTPYELP